MILTEKIDIKVNSMTINHYLNCGYDAHVGQIITVDVNHLTKSSTYKVNVKCDICNSEKMLTYNKYLKNISKHNFYACSNKCSYIKNKKTNLEKYGNETYNNREKYKNTVIKIYGVDNIFKSEIIKNKIKKTNLEKYGFESHNSCEMIKNNKKEQCLEKYGVDNYFKTEDFKKFRKDNIDNITSKRAITFKENCLLKYNVTHTSKLPEIISKIKKTNQETYINKIKDNNITSVNFNDKTYMCNCKICNDNFTISYGLYKNRKKCKTIICTNCNSISKHSSGLEIQLQNFIKENYYNSILFNNKTIINPYELDIYIPELKIAFEFNGLYWHNELNKDNDYHLNKTEECEKQGIQLIHIWEDDWLYKNEIVKSMLLNKLGKSNKLYARKTEIREISDNKLIKDFLDKNHIQGSIGSKIKIGLFYNDELVSLMIFGSRRLAMGEKNIKDNEYELLRYCNKLNTTIIGGASKLFKYFINNYNINNITTYADRSHSQGNLYKQLGFEYLNKTEPNYYYIIDGIRKHRFNFRKDKLVKQGFNENETEHEIMLKKNIYRIYDSGNLKFNYV